MSRFSDYAKTKTFNDSDIFLVDGEDGTHTVTYRDLKLQLMKEETDVLKPANFTDQVYLTKRLGMVNINYSKDITSLTAKTWVTLFTITEEFRPKSQAIVCITNDPGRTIAIMIREDGVVLAYNYGTQISSQTNFSFSVTYMAANI